MTTTLFPSLSFSRRIGLQAIDYCKQNKVSILLVSELSRLGRNAFEVLACVKDLIDSGINLYMQKEQLTLFLQSLLVVRFLLPFGLEAPAPGVPSD